MESNLNIVAMLRTNELRSAISAVCTDMNGTKLDLRVGTLDQVADASSARPSDLLIVDVNPRNSGDLEALRRLIQSHRAHIPVIATAADATLEDVRKLMRLGVADVIPQPVQRADLVTAIEVAARARRTQLPASANRGRVISFLKGGGGAGATTIAVHTGCCMAAAAATKGQNTCLLDFDIQSGTAALYLDLSDRVGLENLIESADRLDVDLLRGVISRHGSGLALLAAPREVIPMESLSPTLVAKVIEIARSHFDFVLIDLPPSWTTWSFEALRQSDEILLVAQMTVSSLRQARRQLDAIVAEGLEDDHVKVVLNRFEKRWGSGLKVKEAEKALGRKIDFFVANDYRTVNEALDQGVPLSAISRRSKANKSVMKLSHALIGAGSAANARMEPHLARPLSA